MTPIKETNAPYPGMQSNAVEFFRHDGELNVIHNKKMYPFTDVPFSIIALLKETIDSDKEVKLALHDMHPTSEVKRLEQFAICRFGGLDFQPDIQNNELQEGEYWPCPLHGKCASEGILCKLPKYNGERLTKDDVNLIRLLTTEATNEVIAEELNYKLGTFHQAKKNLYAKLNVQTKQGVTIVAQVLNII